MNRSEKIILGTFFLFTVIIAVTVVTSNAGLISESICFWVMVSTFLMGIVGGIIVTIMLAKSKDK